MRRYFLGLGVLGVCLSLAAGCGGSNPPKAQTEEPKATPTSAPTSSTPAPTAPQQQPQDPAPGSNGPGAGESSANTPPPQQASAGTGGSQRRAPRGMASGSGGGAASSTPVDTGGAASNSAPPNGSTGQTNAPEDRGSSGPPQQGGPPQGFNNLPPGYGGSGGPPQQGGPPQGFNNLPPGYGGSGGPPQQGGPPQGFNNPPPGYGGSGGPPQQGGPPTGFNNPPPGYNSQPPQQQGNGNGANSAALDDDGGPAPNFGGNNPGQPVQPAAPVPVEAKSFWDLAVNAYASGRDADAYKYLMAEFASNRVRFDEMPLSFSAAEKNTSIGVRFGIAVSYLAQEGVSGKPPVIGDPAPVVNRGNQRGSRGPGSAGGSSGPPAGSGFPGAGGGEVPADARGMLTYYGGDLASSLLDELETRFKREPAYGNVWPKLDVRVMLPSAVANSGQSQVNNNSSRRRGPTSVGAGSGGGGASAMSGFGNQAASSPEGLFPGLTFLGEGNFADLVRKAKNEGLDGLILLEHKASIVRSTGATTSQTTVKFFTCDDGKEKASTAQLSYGTVAHQVAEGKDPVGKELKSLFTKIDRMLALGEMPDLTEELAKGRVESILDASKSEPLSFVNEVNYYLQKGWLNEDDAQGYIIKVLGEPAALGLWSGDFEKQKSALSRWLPAK